MFNPKIYITIQTRKNSDYDLDKKRIHINIKMCTKYQLLKLYYTHKKYMV